MDVSEEQMHTVCERNIWMFSVRKNKKKKISLVDVI